MHAVLNAPGVAPTARQITIDFLYLDLDVCTRCKDTDANLEAILAETAAFLQGAGIGVDLRKTLVASEDHARALGFVSSPTIRVNGRDIAREVRESECDSCGEVAGLPSMACRTWLLGGRERDDAPPAMILDAILRAVYEGSPVVAESAPLAELPDNLRRFFAGKAQRAASAVAPCCAPGTYSSTEQGCCQPAVDVPSCGTDTDGRGGCA